MSEILGLFIIIIVLSFVIWLLILIIGWLWNWYEILSKDIYDTIENTKTIDVHDSWIIKYIYNDTKKEIKKGDKI